MTSPVKQNFYISVSKKEKSNNMKWRGRELAIIKNNQDAEKAIVRILQQHKTYECTTERKLMG